MGHKRAIAATVLCLGCISLEPPTREPSYPFTDFAAGNLVFRWQPDRLPVRYWVSPESGPVAAYLTEAVSTWAGQLLFGEFRGVVVEDSALADVVIRVTPPNPPADGWADVTPVLTACRGQTSFALEGDRLAGPFVVSIQWNAGHTDAQVSECLHRVTLHEVGHTVGLLAHSDADDDVMFANPVAHAPTMRDRRTLEQLYHTSPDLGPPFEAMRP